MSRKLIASLIVNIFFLPFFLIVVIYYFSSIFDFPVISNSSVRMCNTFTKKVGTPESQKKMKDELCDKVIYPNFGDRQSLPDILPHIIYLPIIRQFFGL